MHGIDQKPRQNGNGEKRFSSRMVLSVEGRQERTRLMEGVTFDLVLEKRGRTLKAILGEMEGILGRVNSLKKEKGRTYSRAKNRRYICLART